MRKQLNFHFGSPYQTHSHKQQKSLFIENTSQNAMSPRHRVEETSVCVNRLHTDAFTSSCTALRRRSDLPARAPSREMSAIASASVAGTLAAVTTVRSSKTKQSPCHLLTCTSHDKPQRRQAIWRWWCRAVAVRWPLSCVRCTDEPANT